MSRSFGLVDTKLEEAECFLAEFQKCGWDFRTAQFHFNAFVSSSRSVTFALQASMRGLDGFETWYERWQTKLRCSRLARFFHDCRTDIQHIGRNYVNGGVSGPNGPILLLSVGSFENQSGIPEPNAFIATERYFSIVCAVVRDAYVEFGHLIDPDVFFSFEGMKRNGLTLEDLEEEAGIPRGWTELPGDHTFNDADRLTLIRRSAAISNCRSILAKFPEPSVEIWT